MFYYYLNNKKEKTMKMFKNISIFFKKEPNLYENEQKITKKVYFQIQLKKLKKAFMRRFFYYRQYPKISLKIFLMWLNLRNQSGELLIEEDTDISRIISNWNKNLWMWLINIFVTGFIIQMSILIWYNPGLRAIPLTIFSLGILYYFIIEAIKDIRNAIKKGV